MPGREHAEGKIEDLHGVARAQHVVEPDLLAISNSAEIGREAMEALIAEEAVAETTRTGR